MEEVNILFVMTDSYIYYVSPLILSIIANVPASKVSFYFITPDLSEVRKKTIASLISGAGGASCFCHCDVSDFEGFLSTDRYPKFLYAKMAPHKYLPGHVKRILGLDVDTLVMGDIGELYTCGFEGNYLVGCHNRRSLNNLFLERKDDPCFQKGFNGGVILYNVELMRHDISFDTYKQWLHEYTLKGRNQEQFEEWVMANTLSGKYKLLMPYDYNYNLSAEDLYIAFCQANQYVPKKRIVHFLNSNGRAAFDKPWRYYNHFVLGLSDDITASPFYDYYRMWWFYANQLPKQILDSFRDE